MNLCGNVLGNTTNKYPLIIEAVNNLSIHEKKKSTYCYNNFTMITEIIFY
jgi:hypothetical protein